MPVRVETCGEGWFGGTGPVLNGKGFPLLTLTENAATIVKQITEAPEAPDGAGLRISGAEEGFALAAAPQPEAGDQVLEQDGATVYLDAAAAEQLDAMVLDAGVDETGNLQFGLMAQA